jgi:tetratricopeptide (TPR) repeat protein
LQLAPDHLEALTHQAVLKSAEGQGDAAFDGLNYVLTKDPSFHEAWFFKGMLSMQDGKNEQMKESFEAYIKHAPDSPRKERIKKMLAGGGIQMPSTPGSSGQAAPQRRMAPALGAGGGKRSDELKGIIAKDPNNVAALVELGHLHLRVQDIQAAKIVTEQALALDPDNLEALTHAAVVKSGMGDSEGAFAGLDAVVTKDSTFHEAWFFRGMLSMQAGKSEQMKESFEAYIKHAPESPRKERIKKMLAGGGIQMPRNMNR